MDPTLLTLLFVAASLIAYWVIRAYKVKNYWTSRGIPQVNPLPFIGNYWKLLTMKLNISELHEDICKQFPNEPIIGFYDFSKPKLLIKDANLIEKILIKDFPHFTDHGLIDVSKKNNLDTHLFTMNGKSWKALRNKLAPVFTSGKLRCMYDSMDQCGNSLVSLLNSENGQKKDVEIKHVLERFSMDVIGSCAFGIDAGNLAKPDSEFLRMGQKQFDTDYVQLVKVLGFKQVPKVFKFFGLSLYKSDVMKYFKEVIESTLKYRKLNNVKRNDFIQTMMQLQDKGYVEIQTKDAEDDYLNIDTSTYKTETFEITDEVILGQAYSFLMSGFVSSSITMTYALYELAKHPTIMEKIRQEIKTVVKNGGPLTYDNVKDMNYLEQCVKETLRKYPPAAILFRVCTKEYTLPNGFIVPKGQSIIVPVKAVHYDPKYYPEPNEFQPERFGPDREIPAGAFLPFGNGPRICIAMRFIMMEMKYALAKLLLKYNFEVSSRTAQPLKLDPTNFLTIPKQGVYLNVIEQEVM